MITLEDLAIAWAAYERADDPMTGEDADARIDFVAALGRMTLARRAAMLSDLFDHVCIVCGAELPKWGGCPSCGCPRIGEM